MANVESYDISPGVSGAIFARGQSMDETKREAMRTGSQERIAAMQLAAQREANAQRAIGEERGNQLKWAISEADRGFLQRLTQYKAGIRESERLENREMWDKYNSLVQGERKSTREWNTILSLLNLSAMMEYGLRSVKTPEDKIKLVGSLEAAERQRKQRQKSEDAALSVLQKSLENDVNLLSPDAATQVQNWLGTRVAEITEGKWTLDKSRAELERLVETGQLTKVHLARIRQIYKAVVEAVKGQADEALNGLPEDVRGNVGRQIYSIKEEGMPVRYSIRGLGTKYEPPSWTSRLAEAVSRWPWQEQGTGSIFGAPVPGFEPVPVSTPHAGYTKLSRDAKTFQDLYDRVEGLETEMENVFGDLDASSSPRVRKEYEAALALSDPGTYDAWAPALEIYNGTRGPDGEYDLGRGTSIIKSLLPMLLDKYRTEYPGALSEDIWDAFNKGTGR